MEGCSQYHGLPIVLDPVHGILRTALDYVRIVWIKDLIFTMKTSWRELLKTWGYSKFIRSLNCLIDLTNFPFWASWPPPECLVAQTEWKAASHVAIRLLHEQTANEDLTAIDYFINLTSIIPRRQLNCTCEVVPYPRIQTQQTIPFLSPMQNHYFQTTTVFERRQMFASYLDNVLQSWSYIQRELTKRLLQWKPTFVIPSKNKVFRL